MTKNIRVIKSCFDFSLTAGSRENNCFCRFNMAGSEESIGGQIHSGEQEKNQEQRQSE